MMTNAEEAAFTGKFDHSYAVFKGHQKAAAAGKKSAYVKKAMLLQTGQK